MNKYKCQHCGYEGETRFDVNSMECLRCHSNFIEEMQEEK